MNRRRALKTVFCSSFALGLNLKQNAFAASTDAEGFRMDLLAIGDFGSDAEPQFAVARAMARYAKELPKPPHGLLLVGDNFYGPIKDGVKSERWQRGFEDCYPKDVFPGPCWAVLGNHDYADSEGREKMQLGYAASRPEGSRWTMPAKWFRIDLPGADGKPKVTMLMIDTNWEPINAALHGRKRTWNCWISAEEQKQQQEWLVKQLEGPRAPFTMVIGHHPIYSNGPHQDTKELVADLAPLLEKHKVHVYLCGHDHDMQHLELENQKTSFVISGGGGQRITQLKPTHSGPYAESTYGFTHIEIRDKHVAFRHIDANGKLLHAFAKSADHQWKEI